MIGCDKTVTLVHTLLEPAGEQYQCTVLQGVSWFAKLAQDSDGAGAKARAVIRVRIPLVAAGQTTPTTGDVLVLGVLPMAASPTDWRGLPHFTAAVIGDNRWGKNPHWAVSGA